MPEFSQNVARKLAEEVGLLARGYKKMTARALLQRFGHARRGALVVAAVQANLEEAGIVCTPPLAQVEALDDTIVLSLAPQSDAPFETPKAVPAPPKAPPVEEDIAPLDIDPPAKTPVQNAPSPRLSTLQALAFAQKATVLIVTSDGHGSGFVVERGSAGSATPGVGLIATARHVVGRAEEVKVIFADGSETTGRVLFSHSTLDFAFVRVPPCKVGFKLRGESEPYVGQRVFALGAPRDTRLSGTVTSGIISSTARVEGGVKYLQTDTSISPGNSGGPLIGEDGTVIGMAVWGRSDGPGLNFALPVVYLSSALEWLRPQIPELEHLLYCADCGFLNAPDRWIECRTWICCGNCGTVLAELKPANS